MVEPEQEAVLPKKQRNLMSTAFLTIKDNDLKTGYEISQRVFYSKYLPIINIVLILMSLYIEYKFGQTSSQVIHAYTSVINVVTIVSFLIILLLNRCHFIATWFICPVMTSYAFYYMSWARADELNTSAVFTLVIGTMTVMLICVQFSECWLISTAAYMPCLGFYMWKTGKEMVGKENNELVARLLFCSLLYAIIAYKVEMNNKRIFINAKLADANSNAFYKVFGETVTDGFAVIRDGKIDYANAGLM